MPPLTIDKDDIPAVAAITRLSDASVNELVAALSSAPLVSDVHELAASIDKKVQSIPLEHLKLLLDGLQTLYFIRAFSGVRPHRFLDDLIDGIQNEPALVPPERELPKLRKRLEKLLNIEVFSILSKAERLQRDGERLYCDAKVLSDIRPIFGTEPGKRPLGAVVTHTLRIGYHEGGDHKEFHVVLDSSDLEALGEIVARANEKDDTLRKFLREAKLPDLGV